MDLVNSGIIESLNQTFDEDVFVLVEKEEAEFKIEFIFKIFEVFDAELIKPEYNLRLYQGTAEMKLFHNGSLILDGNLKSKAFSDADAEKAMKSVLDYIVEEALTQVRRTIEVVRE